MAFIPDAYFILLRLDFRLCESSSILCLTPSVWPYWFSNESAVFSKVLPPWTPTSVSSVTCYACSFNLRVSVFSWPFCGGRRVAMCMCRWVVSKWEEFLQRFLWFLLCGFLLCWTCPHLTSHQFGSPNFLFCLSQYVGNISSPHWDSAIWLSLSVGILFLQAAIWKMPPATKLRSFPRLPPAFKDCNSSVVIIVGWPLPPCL